jgi:hypothetical protein
MQDILTCLTALFFAGCLLLLFFGVDWVLTWFRKRKEKCRARQEHIRKVNTDCEIMIRTTDKNRLHIEAHWPDMDKKTEGHIKADISRLPILALFDIVQQVRENEEKGGGNSISGSFTWPCEMG